jgi:hypothetical protein
MRVFELRTTDRAYSLMPVSPAGHDRIRDLNGTALSPAEWIALEVRAVRDGSGGDIATDFALVGSEVALSLRAAVALQELLVGDGQLLPLRCADGDYSVFNAFTIPDALDEADSDIHRFSTGRVMRIDRYAFHADSLVHHTIFRIPQLPRAFTFVTDRFVEAAASIGLSGLAPRLVWESLEAPSAPAA